MTRVKISAGILSLLIILSIFFGIRINRRCDELLQLTDDIRISIEKNDSSSALAAAEKLEQRWEAFRKTASIMVKSDKMTEISRINSRIIPMLENGSEEISADLDELSEMIRLLQNSETPLLTNIL
ncbi:MAG: DUF4363 family protein [Ruminococcus sp.]|nr:DUF4363 family protein [Ruminococcus sp.]